MDSKIFTICQPHRIPDNQKAKREHVRMQKKRSLEGVRMIRDLDVSDRVSNVAKPQPEVQKAKVEAPLKPDTSPLLIELRDIPKTLNPVEVRQAIADELRKNGMSESIIQTRRFMLGGRLRKKR